MQKKKIAKTAKRAKKQKQQKSKAIAFTFRPFLATYFIFEKEAKNSKKVRLEPLLFVHF
jgi:hypothetical protein